MILDLGEVLKLVKTGFPHLETVLYLVLVVDSNKVSPCTQATIIVTADQHPAFYQASLEDQFDQFNKMLLYGEMQCYSKVTCVLPGNTTV